MSIRQGIIAPHPIAIPTSQSVTLSAADKAALIVLSGGNLTATMSGVNWQSVRATRARNQGVYYYEVHFDNAGGVNYLIGLAAGAGLDNVFVGNDAFGWGAWTGGGAFNSHYHSGSNVAFGSTGSTGDTLGVKMDWNAGTVTYYLNGVSLGTPSNATGIFGALYPMVSVQSSKQLTAHFKRSELLYLSAGATPWEELSLASVTLVPTDKGVGITLSGGNLTASNVTGNWRGVRAGLARAVGESGPWYYEAHVDSGAGSAIMVGLASGAAGISSYPGAETYGYGYLGSASKWNQSSAGYGATFTAGDVVGALWNPAAGTITFYKNGVSQGVAFNALPAAQHPNELYPMIGILNGAVTARFTRLGMTGIPAGALAWDGT